MSISLLQQVKSAFEGNKPLTVNGPDFPNGFIITEAVNGSFKAEDQPMRLALVGNAMPHIPFKWGGEQRINEIYYPGNPIPSLQILGGKEGPLVIKGRFTDKRQPITGKKPVATILTDVLDEIRQRGNYVRLELGEWVRYGVLTKTDFMMRTLRSIEYELTFFIISDVEPLQNPILGGKNLPDTSNEKLKDLTNRMQANIASYPTDFPKSAFETISAIVSDVAKKVAVVTSAVDGLIAIGEQTSAGLNRAVGLVAVVKGFVFKSNQRLGKLNLDVEVRKKTLKAALSYSGIRRAYPQVARQSVSDGYKNVAKVQETQRIMRDMQKFVAQIGSELEKFISTQPARRHLVKQSETLQTIAVLHYNNAELWEKIRDHNKLTNTLITAGSVLEIPK